MGYRRQSSATSASKRSTRSASQVRTCPTQIRIESSLTCTLLDQHLEGTLFLRSSPITSLRLSCVADIDDATHAKIVQQLPRFDHGHTPDIVCEIARELQDYASLRNLGSYGISTTLSSFRPIDLGAHRGPIHTRREPGENDFKGPWILENFSELDIVVGEMDYSLISRKMRENPDFPIIPMWHDDYEAQRDERDILMQVAEDSTTGFFLHAVTADMIQVELKDCMEVPDADYLREMRAEGLKEFKKMCRAEAKKAKENEPNRLVRVKIEPFLEQVGGTPKKDQAIRFIKVEALKAAGIATLSLKEDAVQIVEILRSEMHKVLDGKCELAGIDDVCVCDIISTDDDGDVSEHHWNDPKAIDIACNAKKRERIAEWAASIDDKVVIHSILDTDDILEPNYDCEALIWAEKAVKEPAYRSANGLMIAFELSADKKSVVLPLVDGYPDARSEGFFTNMSGLTNVSCDTSNQCSDTGSQANSDSDLKDDNEDGGDSSQSSIDKPCSCDDKSQEDSDKDDANSKGHPKKSHNTGAEHDDAVIYTPGRKYAHLNAERANKILLAKQRAGISTHQPRYQPLRPIYNKKVAAMANPEFLDARRTNNLYMAWNVPHRAHGPQQPGMRYQHRLFNLPCPDWDAPGVEKPRFAQQDEEAGAMDSFCAYWETLDPEMREMWLGRHYKENEVQDVSFGGESYARYLVLRRC